MSAQVGIMAVNGIVWTYINPMAPELVGFIPDFLHQTDPRPAAEQFAANYCGGWDTFKGFTIGGDFSLKYPGDPVMHPIMWCMSPSGERVFIYESGWTMVLQQDGNFEVARLD